MFSCLCTQVSFAWRQQFVSEVDWHPVMLSGLVKILPRLQYKCSKTQTPTQCKKNQTYFSRLNVADNRLQQGDKLVSSRQRSGPGLSVYRCLSGSWNKLRRAEPNWAEALTVICPRLSPQQNSIMAEHEEKWLNSSYLAKRKDLESSCIALSEGHYRVFRLIWAEFWLITWTSLWSRFPIISPVKSKS